MDSQAYVASIEALREFRASLLRFVGKVNDILAAINAKARDTASNLEEAVHDALRRVEHCRDRVDRAREVLESCQCSGDPKDDPPDCSYEERQVEDAEDELRDAEDRLAELEDADRQFRAALDEYEPSARRLQERLSLDMPHADFVLSAKLAALDEYAAVSAAEPEIPASAAPPTASSARAAEVLCGSETRPGVRCGLTGSEFEIGKPFPKLWHDLNDGFKAKVKYERSGGLLVKHVLVAHQSESAPDDNHVHLIESFHPPLAPSGGLVCGSRVLARVKIRGGRAGSDRDDEVNRGHLLNRLEKLLKIPLKEF